MDIGEWRGVIIGLAAGLCACMDSSSSGDGNREQSGRQFIASRHTDISRRSIMRWCCLMVVAVIIFPTLACENSTNLSRRRRYLVFPKNARAGIRVNFKHNRVVPITTILAYSDGMRLTWDLPSDLAYLKPIMLGRRAAQRRDVLDFIERGMSEFGLDGEACVLRAMCETADQVAPVSGLIKKILHRIFAIPEDEMGGTAREILLRERSGNCEQRFARRCPISLLGPSTLQQDTPRQELHPRD